MHYRHSAVGNRQSAFTLLELMVTVGIMVILAGLLFPAIGNALRKSREVQCASNLSKLYRAYEQRKADEDGISDLAYMSSGGWAGHLLAYLDQHLEVFVCPEEERSGSPMHYGGVNASVHYRVRPSGWEDYGILGFDPASDKGSTNSYVSLPDVNGTWQVRRDGGRGPHTFTIDGVNSTITFDGGECRPFLRLLDGSGQRKIEDFENTGESATVEIVRRCSYGMTSRDDEDLQGREKILLMDYDAVEIPSRVPPQAWPDPAPFARHRGKVNVLFANGSVKRMDPAAIDPFDAGNREKYWEP